MSYKSKQLENGRWGIFAEERLIASIGCFDTCEKVIRFLDSRSCDRSVSNLPERRITSVYFHKMKLRP